MTMRRVKEVGFKEIDADAEKTSGRALGNERLTALYS